MRKRKKTRPDYIILCVCGILILFGFLIIAGASAPISQKRFDNPFAFLSHQFIFGLAPGIVLGYIAFKTPLSLIKKISLILMIFSLILTILVFIPKIGVSIRGASRWISFGPFSFQPSELLKITFIIYLAALLSNKKTKTSHFLLSFLIILGIMSIILVIQPDASTLITIVGIALVMYFVSGAPIFYTILIIAGGIGGAFLLVKTAPYRFNRFLVFLNPDFDPLGLGYQIKQSLITIGSGGILGQGLGMGKQKFGLLPQPISDSIFAIFAEEMGFVGCFALIFLFSVLCWQGLKIAKDSKDNFSQLIAVGIITWISGQTIINIGAMIGLLPLTGIPLPFISYGGSALVMEMIGMGLLLNISKKKN